MYPQVDTPAAVEDLLTVTVSELAPGTILCLVSGDLDAATGPSLQHTLTDVLRGAPAHLVIDLTQVEFMASIGLHILAAAHKTQHAAGRHLALVVGHNEAVTRPLQITGLDCCLDLHTDLATAVGAASSGLRRRSALGTGMIATCGLGDTFGRS